MYPQKSRDNQTRGVLAGELYSSRDCPGMVCVSQESRDTQGVPAGELYPSRDCPGIVWNPVRYWMCCTLSHVHVAVHVQGSASTCSQCIYIHGNTCA